MSFMSFSISRFCLTSVSSLILLTLAACLTACDGSGPPRLSAAAQIGKEIFHDSDLSRSGRQSCATCHVPENAHAPTNPSAVQPGGGNRDIPGFRATPSLRYLHLTPRFSFDREGVPSGGFAWDGRAPSLAMQANEPFFALHEMANTSPDEVVAKVARAAYAPAFKKVFGADIFSDPAAAMGRITFTLQQYQLEDRAFHPFDSKFDRFLEGKVALDAAEARGLALFNDPKKGNCAACHSSARRADGIHPLFTDFTFDNIGVPRNELIPATADPSYFDLGLCDPKSLDLSTRTEFCGRFKVPTLRNVTTRHVFFHNGKFTDLKEVMKFYVQRDTHPELWYPKAADGSVLKFNDLPEKYRDNVNTKEVPYDRKLGDKPALSEQEIDDVLRFLATLEDGYKVKP